MLKGNVDICAPNLTTIFDDRRDGTFTEDLRLETLYQSLRPSVIEG